ncbi:MAG: AAA family ATPase [Pseudomonadales bacterium]
MARMIPEDLAPDIPSSERYVFNRLKESLPDNWIVIHGRRFLLPSKGRPHEGEVDFLVLDPARGLLGLEVKGGGIERTEKGWFSKDRYGAIHPIKDPGRQSADATHAIYKFLNSANRFGRQGYRCKTGWGVIFPDFEVRKSLGPGLPREVVLDRHDLADAHLAVTKMFKFCDVQGPALSEAAMSALLEELLPTFSLIPSLAARFQQDRDSLIRLTDEQTDTLDMLEANNRVAIEGAAGTGKTLLALEKARRLAAAGSRTLFLCFNRPLADELNKSADGFEVDTFHGFCSATSKLAKLAFKPPKGADQQAFWNNDAPEMLLEALELLPNVRYDAIVVDEGQDFKENWWPVIDEALADRPTGTLYVFFDPNQNIYEGGPPTAIGVSPIRLKYNCRNTTRIAEYSAQFVGAEVRSRVGAPQGAEVQRLQMANNREVLEQLRKTLHQLVVEQEIDPGQIVVLTARSVSTSLASKIDQLGNFRLVNIDSRKGALDIAFTSLGRFKGLEADAVILIDVESGAKYCSAAHLYVGASRARHLLVVLEKRGERAPAR